MTISEILQCIVAAITVITFIAGVFRAMVITPFSKIVDEFKSTIESLKTLIREGELKRLKLEERVAVLDEKQKVNEHRISDLEKFVFPASSINVTRKE